MKKPLGIVPVLPGSQPANACTEQTATMAMHSNALLNRFILKLLPKK
jgi:hypothetical protein